MKLWKAELFCEMDLILGEGARWHHQWQKLLYIDIKGKSVGAIDPITKHMKLVYLEKMPGMLTPIKDDELLLALQGEISILNFKTGKVKTLQVLGEDANNRCNDGACDASGRLWVGTMNVNAQLNAGNLYCYDGNLSIKIPKTSVSNGICWSLDHRIMYYIDSFDYNIKAFEFELTTAVIRNEREIILIKEENCVADGMCIDEEGMLWVAMWGGGCVNRYNPVTGKCIDKVEVDAPHVTSCAFGGENLQTLFITTAKDGLSEDEMNTYPLSGSLFSVDVGVKGVPVNFFKQN